jgi:mRNA interferase MazF
MEVVRFGVYWATLDPTIGREIKKTRPVVIVSPDVVNKNLKTVIVCPLTTSQKAYPTRIKVIVGKKKGSVALDQIRSIDKSRLMKKIADLNKKESNELRNKLVEMMK